MAYCRFSDSDAYIYDDIYMGLVCAVCSLDNEPNYFVAENDYDLMIAHVAEHRKAGDSIPDYVEMELESDRDDKEWQAKRSAPRGIEVGDISQLLKNLGFDDKI